MDVDELAKNDRNASLNDSFLISFEPLLDKYATLLDLALTLSHPLSHTFSLLPCRRYATLLARANERFNGPRVTDRATPLGQHHPRGVVLPFAVAPHASRGRRDGLSPINVSRIAGCSSLVPFNENNSV